MQFSKKVAELSRLYSIDPKDVLFAMLATSGASTAESFAVIYRPTCSTQNALQSRASNYIGQKAGLRKLIDELNAQQAEADPDAPKKRGRKRKDPQAEIPDDSPRLDYTDKDAVLQELARIAERSEKESDKLAAIREISALQRMKQEAAIDDEKRVIYWVPLNYLQCDELLNYLRHYYADKGQITENENK